MKLQMIVEHKDGFVQISKDSIMSVENYIDMMNKFGWSLDVKGNTFMKFSIFSLYAHHFLREFGMIK